MISLWSLLKSLASNLDKKPPILKLTLIKSKDFGWWYKGIKENREAIWKHRIRKIFELQGALETTWPGPTTPSPRPTGIIDTIPVLTNLHLDQEAKALSHGSATRQTPCSSHFSAGLGLFIHKTKGLEIISTVPSTSNILWNQTNSLVSLSIKMKTERLAMEEVRVLQK